MKKMFALLLSGTILLGGMTPAFAAPVNVPAAQMAVTRVAAANAASPNAAAAPVAVDAAVAKTAALTTRIEPIRVPDAASVMAAYRWEGDNLYRSQKQETTVSIINTLKTLKDGDVVLNIPNIKPADMIIEMRIGNEDSVRYHIYSKKLGSRADQIIYQKVEDGLCFQGMGFTGGNIADVISNLSKITSYESKGDMPFTMTADIKEIYLLRMGDLTTTKIGLADSVKYIQSLFNVLLGDLYGKMPISSENELGKPLTDITDVMLELKDGTRFTFTLYEKGIKTIKTERSLNVPVAKIYRVDADIYAKLLAAMRQNQSACSPLELSTMDVHQILSIEVMNPSGTKMMTYKPGQKAFDSLVDELQGIVVQPLSLKQQPLKNQLMEAYNLRIVLNNDDVYSVNCNKTRLEVSSSTSKYASTYTLADGFNDSTIYFESLLK